MIEAITGKIFKISRSFFDFKYSFNFHKKFLKFCNQMMYKKKKRFISLNLDNSIYECAVHIKQSTDYLFNFISKFIFVPVYVASTPLSYDCF